MSPIVVSISRNSVWRVFIFFLFAQKVLHKFYTKMTKFSWLFELLYQHLFWDLRLNYSHLLLCTHTHTRTHTKLFVYPHTQALRHVDCPEQMPSSSWNVTMGTNPGKDDVSRTSAHVTSTCWTPKQLDRKTLREYSIGLNISYDSLHESPLVLEMGKQKRCLY